jgi:hypothetical protein
MHRIGKQRLRQLERESIKNFQIEFMELINELVNCLNKILSNEERRILAKHLHSVEDSDHFLAPTGEHELDEIIKKVHANVDANHIIEELRPLLIKAELIDLQISMSDKSHI